MPEIDGGKKYIKNTTIVVRNGLFNSISKGQSREGWEFIFLLSLY